MAIITRTNKDASVRYQVKVKDRAGNWYAMPSFDTRVEAENHETALFERNRKGGAAHCKDARITSFSEFVDVWKQANRDEVSDGWKMSQDQMLRDHIVPILGELMMIDIAAPEVGKVMSAAKKKGLGDRMRLHVYTLMKQIFEDAVGYYEMLLRNPVSPDFHRPSVAKTVRDFLKPAEAMQLLDFTRDHYLGVPIWIMLLSAPRIGEMQFMKGQAIDLAQSQILISGTYDKKMKRLQDYPKNGAWAYVPVPPMLKEYLESFTFRRNEFIAKSLKGEMLSYNTFQKALKSLCRKAGVLELSPHELRHTCTEIWIEAGASQEDLRRLLNHSSPSSTAAYIHRTNERLQRISETVGRPALRLVGNSESFPNGQNESCASSSKEVAHAT